MNRIFSDGWRLGIAALGVMLLSGVAMARPSVGLAEPSERLAVQFYAPGLVKVVPVREGDRVEAGQLLAEQETYVDQLQLESLVLEAESRVNIEAQETDLAAKQVELERIQGMHANNVATDAELRRAQLEVDLARARVSLAEQEQRLKQIEAQRYARRLELMRLVSPIDGEIQQVNIGAGEIADWNKPEGAIVIVKNDPLWIVVRGWSSEDVARLEIGQTLQVRYPGEQGWETAKVISRNPQGDASSNTRAFRLELANPQGRASGVLVEVRRPEAAAADRDDAAQDVRAER